METVKSLGQKESERQGKKVLGIALLLLFLNYGILILTNNYGSIVEQQSGFQYVVSLTMVINNIIDAIRDGWLPLGTMGAILLTVFAIFEVKEEKYYLEYFRITEKGILKLDTSISLECLKYLPIAVLYFVSAIMFLALWRTNQTFSVCTNSAIYCLFAHFFLVEKRFDPEGKSLKQVQKFQKNYNSRLRRNKIITIIYQVVLMASNSAVLFFSTIPRFVCLLYIILDCIGIWFLYYFMYVQTLTSIEKLSLFECDGKSYALIAPSSFIKSNSFYSKECIYTLSENGFRRVFVACSNDYNGEPPKNRNEMPVDQIVRSDVGNFDIKDRKDLLEDAKTYNQKKVEVGNKYVDIVKELEKVR